MATRRTAVGKWYEGQKGSEISQETSAICNTIKSGHPPNQFVSPVTGIGGVAAKWRTIVMRIQGELFLGAATVTAAGATWINPSQLTARTIEQADYRTKQSAHRIIPSQMVV